MFLHRIPAYKSRRHDREEKSDFSNPYCSNGFREGWPDDSWKRTCGANKIVTWFQWLLCRLFARFHSEMYLYHGEVTWASRTRRTSWPWMWYKCAPAATDNVRVPPHPPAHLPQPKPGVMAWGVTVWEVIRSWGQSPHEEASALIKRDVRELTPRTQWRGSHLWARKWVLIYWYLDLGLPSL